MNFRNALLALHIDKVDLILSRIKNQTATYNELFDLLAGYPDELKFCKQLSVAGEEPEMKLVHLQCISIFKPVVFPLLKSHFKFTDNQEHLASIWLTFVESWQSGLDVNNLTSKHMKRVSEETGEIIIKLNQHYDI